MERLCQLLTLAGIIAATTLSTATATFRPPWFAGAYHHQLVSYNAALFPAGSPEVEERTDILIQQLRRSSADVFCLQEVWLTETQRKVYQEVKDRYPYINCQPALRQLSPACLGCLFVGGRGQQCLADSASLYGDTFGLMLLSKKRLTDVKVEPFLQEATRLRGYVLAGVSGIGNVICTHLTTALVPFYGGPPYTDPFLFSSYAEQQYDELLKLFNATVDLQTPIIMGDFNHGPASPGVTWDLPFHYGLMNARGFVSPYVLYDGRCTWCVTNPLVTGQGFSEDLIIDHVYVPTNSLKRVKGVKRIFDNISTANGTPLSDHYGVQITLKKRYWGRGRRTSGLLPLPPPQMDLDELCAA